MRNVDVALQLVPPRSIFMILITAMIVSTVVSTIPGTIPELLKSVITLTLSCFSQLVIAYLLYSGLRVERIHIDDLSSTLQDLCRVIGESYPEHKQALLELERVRASVQRIPRRRSTLLVTTYIVFGITSLLLSLYGVWRIRGLLEKLITGVNLEELFLYLGIVSLGGLLAVVSLVALFYTLHVLNRDLLEVERIEDSIALILRTSGIAHLPERTYTVPRRSTVLYVVLSLITLGIFVLYWIYVVTLRDLRKHLLEDRVLAQHLTHLIST